MATVLMEGQWTYRVDEKGRFPLPPKIRTKFSRTWVLALEPASRKVTIFPFEVWQKVITSVENPMQFRMVRRPFQADIDSQGRLTIPRKLRELAGLGQTVMVMSLGDRLLLQNAAAEKSYTRRN